MTDSRSLPDLPNKPDETNWVEKAGGLPKLIERIAKHLRSERGYTVSRAIATAASQVQKVCATGRTFGGRTEVNAKYRAECCAAAAEWKAKAARSKLRESYAIVRDEHPELTEDDWTALGESASARLAALERAGLPATGEGAEFDRFLVEAARRSRSEDDPAFNWRRDGNGKRGVVLKDGTRKNVTGPEFDALRANGAIDQRRTPTLRGDKDSDAPATPINSGDFEAKHPRGRKGSPQGGKFVAKGSTGREVRAVQRRVRARVDGAFGDRTREAVMRFQRDHGLQVDGVVGRQTVAALRGRSDAKRVKTGALTEGDRAFLRGHVKGSGRARG